MMYQSRKLLLTCVRCFLTTLLCFPSLAYQSYCTTQEVLGLKLGSIHQKLDKGQGRDAKSRQESAEYLDQLLATVPFRKSTEELTKISFPRETTLSGSQISDVDTDNDDIDKLDAVKLGKKRKKPYNASRLLYSTKEGSVDNCLQQRDLLPPDEIGEDSRQTAQQHMQKLCRRLVLDALRIVEAHLTLPPKIGPRKSRGSC